MAFRAHNGDRLGIDARIGSLEESLYFDNLLLETLSILASETPSLRLMTVCGSLPGIEHMLQFMC